VEAGPGGNPSGSRATSHADVYDGAHRRHSASSGRQGRRQRRLSPELPRLL